MAGLFSYNYYYYNYDLGYYDYNNDFSNATDITTTTTTGNNDNVSHINKSTDSNRSDSTTPDILAWTYVAPPIFLIGVVGNLLILLVASQRPTRNKSSGVYLQAMSSSAVVVYVSGLLVQWLTRGGIFDLAGIDAWFCRFHTFIYYTSNDVAIWALVLFTFDRLVAVCFPLKKNLVCTKRRAIIVCCIASVVAVARNLYIFFLYDTESTERLGAHIKINCKVKSIHEYQEFKKESLPWIIFGFDEFFPVLAIFLSNVFIVRALVRARHSSAAANAATTRMFKMTSMMCVLASFAFILFNSPIVIMIILSERLDSTALPFRIAQALCNLLQYVNYASNFFLYSLGGRNFRSCLKESLSRMFCRICERSKRDTGRAASRGKNSNTNGSSSAVKCGSSSLTTNETVFTSSGSSAMPDETIIVATTTVKNGSDSDTTLSTTAQNNSDSGATNDATLSSVLTTTAQNSSDSGATNDATLSSGLTTTAQNSSDSGATNDATLSSGLTTTAQNNSDSGATNDATLSSVATTRL